MKYGHLTMMRNKLCLCVAFLLTIALMSTPVQSEKFQRRVAFLAFVDDFWQAFVMNEDGNWYVTARYGTWTKEV